MDVILLEKIENLGEIGDHVRVKPGYGRNFLLPKGKAAMATEGNIARFEAMRVELEKKAADTLVAAKARATELEGLEVTLSAKAGSEGKLFGSIGALDVAEACTRAGAAIDRSEVRLPDGPIRVVGEHEVTVHLHFDVDVVVRVVVVAEE